MKDFKLILVDPKSSLCEAWRKHFEGYSNITIVNGYFETIPEYDCMVSAANSFGLMDGGVDLAIIKYFGLVLERKVQAYILEHYLGEQPVGSSFIIATDHPDHPFLAHTPTMRVPMTIATTDYIYNATRAMLLAVYRHNLNEEKKINSVVCPGLGTATGRMPIEEAARQMSLAYRTFIEPPTRVNWTTATALQRLIGRGGDLVMGGVQW